MHRLVLRPILAILGLYHLLLGVAMVAAPRTFFDEVATYGVFNDHYIRDVASFYLALGIVMLVAVAKVSGRRRCWCSRRSSTGCTSSTTCGTSATPTRAGSGRPTPPRSR